MSSGSRALLKYSKQLTKPENKGLQYAIDQIEDIKHDGNHITALLSYADLIQLGGYAAVEYTGGPSLIFRMGRIDAEESETNARLADSSDSNETVL